MPKFEIWSEGYRASGDSGDATFHGVVEAPTFEEACDIKFAGKEHEGYYRRSDRDGKPIYWGCGLYDNEADARKAFG